MQHTQSSSRALRARRSRRGAALLTAVFAAFVAATMIAVLMTLTQAANERVDVERHRTRARYLAEGALAVAQRELQTSLANWNPVPQGGVVSINGHEAEYFIEPTGLETLATDEAGIQTLVSGYELRAVGRSQRSSDVAHRLVNAEATPIFQFAVFYDGDLEIFPGPSMTLKGRVHTNSNLYLGCGGTLTVDTNYLRSAGSMYRVRKDMPDFSPGTVEVRQWVENPFDLFEPEEYVAMLSLSQMADLGVTTISGYDSAFTGGHDLNGDGDFYDLGEWLPWGPGALDFWSEPFGYVGGEGHTVLSQAHGVSEAVVPHIDSIAMFEESSGGSYAWDEAQEAYVAVGPGAGTHNPGFFHGHADLSILTYADGTWDAFDAAGFEVTSSVASVVKQKSLYDARQASGSGDTTDVTEIDLQKLSDKGMFPANGLLYAAHYGMGEGTQAKGVLLKNGAELQGPLTVVSEGAVYVQGDYNTVDKKGAAVIGDAVNLLSNDWDGRKSAGELPGASETTFNLALITGNHETEGADYNGGLENLPRFHESWDGVPCHITGSFVNTWTSRYATGKWAYGGDHYLAPGRNWQYDADFNRVEKLPPFTPMAVSATSVVSW